LLFREVLRAATGAERYAHFALFFHREFLRIDTRILQCFRGSRKSQRHGARDVLSLQGIHPVELVEILNLARDLDGNIGGVEPGNGLDSAFARQDRTAESGIAVSIGADRTHPGNHRASKHDRIL